MFSSYLILTWKYFYSYFKIPIQKKLIAESINSTIINFNYHQFQGLDIQHESKPKPSFNTKSTLSDEVLLDHILGTIYGNCIGDAIGLLTEFMTKKEAMHVSSIWGKTSIILPLEFIFLSRASYRPYIRSYHWTTPILKSSHGDCKWPAKLNVIRFCQLSLRPIIISALIFL